MKMSLSEIVKQLRWCNYQSVAGPLTQNHAWFALEEYALTERMGRLHRHERIAPELLDAIESLAHAALGRSTADKDALMVREWADRMREQIGEQEN